MILTLSVLCVLSAVPRVLSHGGVLSYKFGSATYKGWTPYNTRWFSEFPVISTLMATTSSHWTNDYSADPILDPMSSTIACNDDGTSGALQLTATNVAAGTTVVAYWNQVWPHPYGPMLTYLAKCPGSTCTGVNPSSLKWFKIDHSGLISGTVGAGYWGSGKMIDQNSTWTMTIPKTVPSGNYLLRHETIALHSLPAQFYPECAQIEITGGGSLAPTAAQLVSFPGAYKSTDPGINCDLYSNAAKTQTTYVIPGPPLYGSSGSGGGTTTVTTPTTTTQTTPPTSVPGSVAHYGQCGGQDYTGPTGWCVIFMNVRDTLMSDPVLRHTRAVSSILFIPSAFSVDGERSKKFITTSIPP
ncbi:glycosyl hydrolase family 61-domain-containing protein [Mycena rebaudengoi]|nr:glycosyl hydrolase family 61-domain-containing protein [Mycena rebaudengoi]